MRSLFTYFDDAQSKVLVQEKVNAKRSQISVADVMTLINNLNELSGTLPPYKFNTLDETYLNQFLITFRYFISPNVLFNKLVLRYVNATSKSKDEMEKIQERLIAVFFM